jgi:hypothetical protein
LKVGAVTCFKARYCHLFAVFVSKNGGFCHLT